MAGPGDALGSGAAILGGAGIGAAGSLASSAFNWLGQREQRSWEERMANTAYQRATADMRAAGLNPGLMYGSGSAAATPNVAAPTAANPFEGIPHAMQASAQMALETQRVANETRANDAEIDKKRAEVASLLLGQSATTAGIARTEAETSNLKATLPNILAELGRIQAQTAQSQASAKSTLADLPVKQAVGDAITALRSLFEKTVPTAVKGGVPFEPQVQKILDGLFGPPGGPRRVDTPEFKKAWAEGQRPLGADAMEKLWGWLTGKGGSWTTPVGRGGSAKDVENPGR